jgi:hypothetical protein
MHPTMPYTHVLNKGGQGVKSPLELEDGRGAALSSGNEFDFSR